MKKLIVLEELAKFSFCYLASLWLGYSWWWFWALLLLPDLSMLAYLLGPKAGAWFYNFFHHQGVAIAVGAAGVW